MEETRYFAILFGRCWIDAVGDFNRTTFVLRKGVQSFRDEALGRMLLGLHEIGKVRENGGDGEGEDLTSL